MKTPFCVAIGIRQRELDEFRRAIAVELACLARVAERAAVIDAATTAERRVAAGEWLISTDLYFGRLRDERVRSLAEHSRATDDLVALRDGAGTALASLRAIEEAAADWRSEARARAEAVDQLNSDDRAAATHATRVAADRKRAA